ncbi:hypothetical protein AURDEDRAFT_163854 [Auricularia subglabra TFB-10046 SS5]|nr:hypothetical protein AURDEDRAFT_163854 [Auricularia subglabra TFB-10046 SS5]
MTSDQRTHYPRVRREEGSQLGRQSSSSMGRPMPTSSIRPDDPRRARTPGYMPPPPQPRTDRNFLVPRSDAPVRDTCKRRAHDLHSYELVAVPQRATPDTMDPSARMREIGVHHVNWASLRGNLTANPFLAELTLLNQTGNPALWQSRVPPPPPPSTQSIYYHPATQQRTPFAQHLAGESIHRPSTAPPQQLRSVLAPPQSPDRYRTPRPRSPIEDYPGEFYCKRCGIKFPVKKGFTDHMTFTHGIVRMPPRA